MDISKSQLLLIHLFDQMKEVFTLKNAMLFYFFMSLTNVSFHNGYELGNIRCLFLAIQVKSVCNDMPERTITISGKRPSNPLLLQY